MTELDIIILLNECNWDSKYHKRLEILPLESSSAEILLASHAEVAESSLYHIIITFVHDNQPMTVNTSTGPLKSI